MTDAMAETSKARVLAAWKAFGSRDHGEIERRLTPDCVWTAPPGNATAVALGIPSTMVGAAAISRFLVEEFGRLFVSDVRVEITSVIATADTVILEERMRATLIDGVPYDNRYCFVFTLKDDLIAGVREYMDTAAGNRMVFGDGQPRQIVMADAT